MAKCCHLLKIFFLLASLSWGDVLYAPPPDFLLEGERVGLPHMRLGSLRSEKANARATFDIEDLDGEGVVGGENGQAAGRSDGDELEQAVLAFLKEWDLVPEASPSQGKVKEAGDSSDDEDDEDEDQEECARYMVVLHDAWEEVGGSGTYMPGTLRALLQKAGRGLVSLTLNVDQLMLSFIILPKK
jgi:hypothetical protein